VRDPPHGWTIERHRGRAGELHHLTDPVSAQRTVRVLDVVRPAIVLGSSQRERIVATARAEATGVDVVRRRSGGGAVLLRPGEQAWIDFLIPAGDPLWHDDVVRAAFWVGETWARALERIGTGEPEVHRGGQVETEWSGLVCFSGLGPGEVTLAGRKVVGLSQRRSRSWTRVQTTAFSHWSPGDTVDLLDLEPAERDGASRALAEAAGPFPAPADEIAAAVLDALPR
jgi:lipoate-protein ligase A